MTHRLTTNYAKNYCNRTLIVKVIVENVVTCFFGTQCIWGVSAELRMPTHKGRAPELPVVLSGWGHPCANFLGSGAVVFLGFWVRCGSVKLVSSSLGSIWGVCAELRMPTHKGEGTWATRSLTSLGRPLRKFLGVRCGSFLGVFGSGAVG